MNILENNHNKITGEEAENISYIFPKSEEISIHKSDLQIQLESFKERVRASFSVFDLLAMVSLWLPLCNPGFGSILGLESAEVQAGYTVFASLITLFFLYSRSKYFVLKFWKKERVSSDAGEMAKIILEQCQSKSKNNVRNWSFKL